jgi:hypothetical protein
MVILYKRHAMPLKDDLVVWRSDQRREAGEVSRSLLITARIAHSSSWMLLRLLLPAIHHRQ